MTHSPLADLRVGCVRYLNAQPLIYGWPEPVDFDTPANLCRKLAAAELDVALVSSFEVLREPVYTIVDLVAVGSDGPVGSVFVAHRGLIDDTEKIVLDPNSRTSVNLLRCLLAEQGLKLRLVESNESISSADARLLIGDAAIRFRALHGAEYNYWDLGERWKELAGLPFVFALWLIRPEIEKGREVAERLRALRDSNLAALDQVIAAQTNFDVEFCQHYFRENLRFGFAEREKEGLLRFRSLCEKHGILPRNGTQLRLI